ncbi:MAG: rubrerythrin family protein [Candidatus Hydrothermarchaeaceae archaeon]
MGKTQKNLEEAFAGESQANRKYLAYSKKAYADGYPNTARLFRAAAESETMHALKHFRVMGAIQDTVENLRDAVEGETHEKTKMYPQFIEEARAEGEKAAEMSFQHANEAEEVHAALYENALKAVENGEDLPKTDYFVCQVCGFAVENEAPDRCPVCGAKKERFRKIE